MNNRRRQLPENSGSHHHDSRRQDGEVSPQFQRELHRFQPHHEAGEGEHENDTPQEHEQAMEAPFGRRRTRSSSLFFHFASRVHGS